MGGFGEVQAVRLFYGMRATGTLQAGGTGMLSAKTEARPQPGPEPKHSSNPVPQKTKPPE